MTIWITWRCHPASSLSQTRSVECRNILVQRLSGPQHSSWGYWTSIIASSAGSGLFFIPCIVHVMASGLAISWDDIKVSEESKDAFTSTGQLPSHPIVGDLSSTPMLWALTLEWSRSWNITAGCTLLVIHSTLWHPQRLATGCWIGSCWMHTTPWSPSITSSQHLRVDDTRSLLITIPWLRHFCNSLTHGLCSSSSTCLHWQNSMWYSVCSWFLWSRSWLFFSIS